MGFNVAWNVGKSEICVKGDNHTVLNNVAWDDNGTPEDKDCTICVPPLYVDIPMNFYTIMANNGGSNILFGGGPNENNYDSPDVKEQMVDPDNNDFRPVPGGAFITPDGGEIIGAYTSGESSKTYWIPGRKLYKASFPIPHNGATVSSERSDVICQTGYLAEKHDFYFGKNFKDVDVAGKDDVEYQLTLHGPNNIFALPIIEPEQEYFWRVDAHRGGYVYKGDVWSFSTNE